MSDERERIAREIDTNLPGVLLMGQRLHLADYILARDAKREQGSPAARADSLHLIANPDARAWAKKFMRLWGYRMAEVDDDLMLGWFANALMSGFDRVTSDGGFAVKQRDAARDLKIAEAVRDAITQYIEARAGWAEREHGEWAQNVAHCIRTGSVPLPAIIASIDAAEEPRKETP